MKYHLITAFLIVFGFANGQITNFPERSFRYFGKIIDNNTRIGLENVQLISAMTSSVLTISDKNGNFTFLGDKENDTIFVYSYGYYIQGFSIKPRQENNLSLHRLSIELTETKISAKPIDPYEIIVNVKKHYDTNYLVSTSNYTQSGYVNIKYSNYDTFQFNTDYIVDVMNAANRSVFGFEIIEKRTNIDNPIFLTTIGYPYASIPRVMHLDIAKSMFLYNEYKKYVYTFVKSVLDNNYGKLLVINCKPKKRLRLSSSYEKDADEELIIREEDYAIISLRRKSTRNIEKLQRITEKQYHEGSQNWTIMPDGESYDIICNYEKDSLFNKYILKYCSYSFMANGKSNATNQNIQIYENLSFYGLNLRPANSENNKYDFKDSFSEVKYHPDFWKNFALPSTSPGK